MAKVVQNWRSLNSFTPAWDLVDHYFLFVFLQFLLTPLHLACWYWHESVVKLLLEHGADVNATDRVSLRTIYSWFFVKKNIRPMLLCNFISQMLLYLSRVSLVLRYLRFIPTKDALIHVSIWKKSYLNSVRMYHQVNEWSSQWSTQLKELRRSLKNDFKASTGPSHRQSCQIVGVPIPEDGRVKEKEDEKVEKYRGLASAWGWENVFCKNKDDDDDWNN